LSVSTSNFSGWSLLVGTDPMNTGQYNVTDLALVPTDTTSRAFNDQATALALERMRAHPAIVAELAVRKIMPMWASEDYAAVWTLDLGDPNQDGERATIALTSQLIYTGVLILAAMALWQERRRRSEVLTLIILIIGATALAHTFLEVQPRYHFFIEPMMCILAGVLLAARYSVRKKSVRVVNPVQAARGIAMAGDLDARSRFEPMPVGGHDTF
jgi:hypothetical protein